MSIFVSYMNRVVDVPRAYRYILVKVKWQLFYGLNWALLTGADLLWLKTNIVFQLVYAYREVFGF